MTDKNLINNIISILDNDGIVAVPTDTVYGLIGNPLSKKAVDKVYKLKNRNYDKKLSIFLHDRSEIKNICIINNKIESFINNELGNNTIILEKIDKNYLNLISDNTIGIRIPDNIFLQKLLTIYSKPIFATSINLSGEKELLTYKEIYNKFNNQIDLIVDLPIIGTNISSSIYRYENNNIIKAR